ncbi:MAG: Esterase [Actinomycetia bacterium]|nr:Esterase [Actinomycetes bacterium]
MLGRNARFVQATAWVSAAVVVLTIACTPVAVAAPPAGPEPIPSSITNGILRTSVDLYFHRQLRFADVRPGVVVHYTVAAGGTAHVAAFVARAAPPALQPRKHALVDHDVDPGELLLYATHDHHAHFGAIGPRHYHRTAPAQSRLYVVNSSVAHPLGVTIDGRTVVTDLNINAGAFADLVPARHTVAVLRDGHVLASLRLPFLDGVLTTVHLISNLAGGHFALTARTTRLGTGYRLLAADGGVFAYGSRHFLGSTAALRLRAPIVGGTETLSSAGYWMVASDGGIFAFGDATFAGSMGGRPLNQPIVGMAPSATGLGYWLVAADGGVFAFGDARFFGSTGAIRLAQPITAMTPTPSGHGYWMLARDGGVFAFGDARFFGSAAGTHAWHRAVALTSNHSGTGYSVTFDDGYLENFGFVARSARLLPPGNPVVAVKANDADDGYWEVTARGAAYRFGNVSRFRGPTQIHLRAPIIAML